MLASQGGAHNKNTKNPAKALGQEHPHGNEMKQSSVQMLSIYIFTYKKQHFR
jgi:hypothetical protein